MSQPFRMPEGGRIDRAQLLTFRFDGIEYSGYAGDSLASALLANGVRRIARSFKYHRPRGIYSAGPEEPNALVQLRHGARTEPNVRATVAELFDGLSAESQNRWPSLAFDLGAVNALAAPLFPAGFYYKTFMWPGGLWRGYEHLIRRMAGLGRAPAEPDPDRYDVMHTHCDVLVVGGGPAGLQAATAAMRSGARVILAEQGALFGASLIETGAGIDGKPAQAWIDKTVGDLADAAEVRLLARTTAFAYHDHNYLGLLERRADHRPRPAPNRTRQRLWKVRARRVILATGAIERPLVFQNNDRPGVMLAGAAAAYVNRYGVRPGRRAVVFTNNDSAYAAALDLHRAGIAIAAIVDARDGVPGPWGERAREAGLSVRTREVVSTVHGRGRVRAAAIARLKADGSGLSGLPEPIDCDLICVSGGWNPAVHLFSQSGGGLRLDQAAGRFLPDRAVQPVTCIGAAAGEDDLAVCLDEGLAAGFAAAAELGFLRRGRGRKRPLPEAVPESRPMQPVWRVPQGRNGGSGAWQFVDLQNDVTAADLGLAVREGYRSIEHVKRYTTLGMGTDQGKTGNVTGMALVAAQRGDPMADVGTTTFRPPYTPVSFGALAGRDIGAFLDPERRSAMHGWHAANGAVFEPVGQWLRPYYYPRVGEDMAAAVRREAKATRTSLGLLDASTLGKIDVQGPDAAEFLNRVYTNAWSKLPVGACRYGLMLHEDGMVFDDGVTARLAENRFHMTTTTGNAAAVLNWLESWLQTEWPDLRVFLTSVTEHWAVAALAGPNARALLAELAPQLDLDAAAFPFMSVREATVAGLPARVFRISFTGELAYEINVPARYGLALWQALLQAGAKYDITPYGTEAMHLLRAEVGFIIVGQETDGTVTPLDLGMDWIVSRRKDFLGKRSLSRADTAREDRRQLVGLLSEDPHLVVPEGAQIIASANTRPPQRMQGHVTSSYFSPNVGRSIALALVERGADRHGETIHIAYDGQAAPARIGPPKFFDPQGSRARG